VKFLLCLLLSATFLALPGSAFAQFAQQTSPAAGKQGKEVVQKWRAGMIITAVGGPCVSLVGSAPIPFDWPEQQVRVLNEEVSPMAKLSYETVGGAAKRMMVNISNLPAGQEAKVLVTFEITRQEQLPPEKTDSFVLPEKKKLDRSVLPYLGPSKYIETTNSKIRSLAKEIGTDKEHAWDHVEAIYDWVREKVQYKEGPIKGAVAALKDGTGDCEELSSLFIAICRAADIPARTVWVHGHCYPEFYLVDEDGKGHWFPCQAAGSRAFGGMPDLRPILQKGDNFKVGREWKRYLAETLTGGAASGKPKVKFVREMVND
jgi:hypothetical protein